MLRPDFPIITQRLTLRAFTPADLDELNSFQSRADVARYLYWGPRSRAESAAALAKRVHSSTLSKEGQFLAVAAELTETGQLIGDLNLEYLSSERRQGEIGFVFHPDHHGKGLAAEAAVEVLRLGFEDLGLHRIIGRCDGRNTSSAALMERLGMKKEAHLRQNEIVKGEWCDELVFAMLEDEWKASRT
ncbi:Protein N-acetyltransferase, RimJ/RimL family [Amycolatopsis lurida]|uniref:Acetyltransferase n=1 Tax=Amycolatopsis lurida NRRL 2430 TaxID=1460371 RepID=A0A2P2FTF9_AMYLU|nr:GNAT family protein [Amycolatopsis lurida]KFU79989.1 acetyltransferase [Amycolatopsis lurida NRRL 2430]SEC81330.1 Protein N-acetyltransferase, RimJ/RimL family [Amycolatopsis lurida]